MPGTISHALSMTTPDDPAYENRPSHWNATHALTLNATGSEISGAFSNANGISFGLSAGAVTASHNALTTAAQSNHSHGNPTLNLTNLSGTTASNSAGFTLSLSAGAGGAGDGVNIIAAGTQTANTTGTVLFSNSNGITFGMSNSSVITASHNAITTGMASNRGSDFVQATAAFAGTSASGTINSAGISVSIGPYITTGMLSNAVTLSNIRVSGGTTSNLLSALTFGDANGISFGLNASTMTASHNALTSQSNQNVTAGNGGFAFQTLSFSNVNGISFGTSAGSAITASHNAITTGALSNHSHGVSFTSGSVGFQTLSFTNSNGISFNSGTQGIFGSHNAITTGALSNHSHGVSFTSGSVAFQTLSFTNSNGISFNSGTQGIFGSHNAITTGALSDHSHGNPTLNLTNLSGTTASASNGFTLSLSAAAPGAAAITQSIGLSTQTEGGSIAGTTGYATGDDVLYHFVPGSNITMSQSLNGASATLSIYGPAAGGGATLSGYDGFANNEFLAIAGGQASLWMDRFDLPCAMQFDRVGLRVTHSNATNSSGSATISAWVGFYTRNNSSLSLLGSTSFSTGITQSGTVGSYSNYGGIKILPIPWTTTFQASNYWVGIISRTTTGGANMSFGNLGNSQIASTMSGYFGSGSNATAGVRLAVGVYSATTSALPAAISITQINGNSSAFLRQPAYLFISNIF